jgi:hypothetical protein
MGALMRAEEVVASIRYSCPVVSAGAFLDEQTEFVVLAQRGSRYPRPLIDR